MDDGAGWPRRLFAKTRNNDQADDMAKHMVEAEFAKAAQAIAAGVDLDPDV